MGYDLIFVGMDASSLQPIVFESALKLSKYHQAELRLLHCVEVEINSLSASAVSVVGTSCGANYISPSDVHFQFTQQALGTRLSEAKQWLQEYCQIAEQQGVRATFEVVLGRPNHQICDLAQTWQADLIVLGRQNHSGLAELFLGSVSNYVLHHAPCSVFFVQGKVAEKKHSLWESDEIRIKFRLRK